MSRRRQHGPIAGTAIDERLAAELERRFPPGGEALVLYRLPEGKIEFTS